MKKVVSIGTQLAQEKMQADFNEVSLIQGEIRELVKKLGDVALLKSGYVSDLFANRITEVEYNDLIGQADIQQRSIEMQLKHAKEKINDLTSLMNNKWGSNFKGL